MHNKGEVMLLKTRIRDLCEDKDLTQAKIAGLLKIHQTTYSDYELGNLNIPAEVLIELVKFCETSVDYILYLSDNSTPYK